LSIPEEQKHTPMAKDLSESGVHSRSASILRNAAYIKPPATIAGRFGLMRQQVNTCLASMEWSSSDREQPRILSDRPSHLSL
jgi:hypothetical protein